MCRHFCRHLKFFNFGKHWIGSTKVIKSQNWNIYTIQNFLHYNFNGLCGSIITCESFIATYYTTFDKFTIHLSRFPFISTLTNQLALRHHMYGFMEIISNSRQPEYFETVLKIRYIESNIRVIIKSDINNNSHKII